MKLNHKELCVKIFYFFCLKLRIFIFIAIQERKNCFVLLYCEIIMPPIFVFPYFNNTFITMLSSQLDVFILKLNCNLTFFEDKSYLIFVWKFFFKIAMFFALYFVTALFLKGFMKLWFNLELFLMKFFILFFFLKMTKMP